MVIGEEAGSATSFLASMRVTESESLFEYRNINEPRTLSKVNQVGLIALAENCAPRDARENMQVGLQVRPVWEKFS